MPPVCSTSPWGQPAFPLWGRARCRTSPHYQQGVCILEQVWTSRILGYQTGREETEIPMQNCHTHSGVSTASGDQRVWGSCSMGPFRGVPGPCWSTQQAEHPAALAKSSKMLPPTPCLGARDNQQHAVAEPHLTHLDRIPRPSYSHTRQTVPTGVRAGTDLGTQSQSLATIHPHSSQVFCSGLSRICEVGCLVHRP